MGTQPGLSAEDFHLGAAVHSNDGVEVGNLQRLLVDGNDYGLRAIVVKEESGFAGLSFSPGSMLLADEVVVPAADIKDVSHERVDLDLSAAEVRRCPPYISYQARAESATDELAEVASVLGQSPAIPRSIHEIAHKPEGELEIEGDENVMLGHTGKKLGTVKSVLFDNDALVGVVMLPGGWFKREVIVPRRFLERSDDLALFVNLTEDELNQLKPFSEDR